MTLKSKSNFSLFSICTKLSNFYQLSDANLVSHLKMSLNLIPFQHKNLQKTPKSHITTSDLLSNENVACSLLSKEPGKKKISYTKHFNVAFYVHCHQRNKQKGQMFSYQATQILSTQLVKKGMIIRVMWKWLKRPICNQHVFPYT